MNDISRVNSESKKIITSEFEKMFELKETVLQESQQKGFQDMKTSYSNQLTREISSYFKRYALQLYGASILEEEQEGEISLKTIFDRVFEDKMNNLQLETKYKATLDQFSKKIEANLKENFSNEIKEETEQLEIQMNSIRCTLKSIQKKSKQDDNSELIEKQDELIRQLEQMCILQEQNTNRIEEKSNIKDVCALVDLKANSGDVFKVLEEMQKTINLNLNRF